MNDTIDTMLEKYKSIDELKAYSNAQYKTITKLTKRLSELEQEIEGLLAKGYGQTEEVAVLIPDLNVVSDEEAICLMELNRLKNHSLRQELTLEECKKVETYVRTLISIREKKTKEPAKTKSMDTADLLKAMDNVLSIPKN